VFIAPVYRGDRLPPAVRLDTTRLAADISARGIPARACVGVAEIYRELVSDPGEPRLVALMSTGDFDGLFARLTVVD
jgi:hypothetical protein